MRIAVTGGAGFIGRHLTTHLEAAGHTITVVDNQPSRAAEPVDVRDPDAVTIAVDGCEAVVHLAGPVAGAFRHGAHTSARLQIDGTVSVLHACQALGIPRLVLASSFYVYTGSTDDTVNEDTPLDLTAMHPFGAAKAYAEHLTLHSATDAVCARIGSVYGPGPGSTNAVNGFIADAANGHIDVWGDPTRPNQFTHVADVAAGLAACLQAPASVYNLTAPDVTTTGQLAEHIAALTGCTIGHQPDKPSGPRLPYMDPTKAIEQLAWQPHHLMEALPEIAVVTVSA